MHRLTRRGRLAAALSPVVAGAIFLVASATSWVSVEDANSDISAWRLDSGKPSTSIEGFADRTSVSTGGSFGLYVSTYASRWAVTAYRLGWYHGAGGRRIWKSTWQTGRLQAAPATSGSTRTARAPWHRSMSVAAKGWPAGVYLLKLHAAGGAENYVLITVRSAATAGRMVLMTADMTIQAYNKWGGRSLYLGPGGYDTRSYAVSFDRPYDASSFARFFQTEQPLILEAERLGLPLAYVSDVDLSLQPSRLAKARAIVDPGHDEYWTWNERSAFTAARDGGANLLFFGANTMWWQVRLGSTALGAGRLVIGYKTNVSLDPATRTDPERATTTWRKLPQSLPEHALVGIEYACVGAANSYVVAAPGFFALRGTGAREGSRYPGLVGSETDRAVTAPDTPAGLEVVAHSPANCRYGKSYADSSYYVAKSRAGVFSTGTTGWVYVLGGGRKLGATAATTTFVREVTDNLLRVFAAGPSGVKYPSSGNLKSLGSPSVNANPEGTGD